LRLDRRKAEKAKFSTRAMSNVVRRGMREHDHDLPQCAREKVVSCSILRLSIPCIIINGDVKIANTMLSNTMQLKKPCVSNKDE
jgi:hypothetical protein